jgi:flagellar biosynthetic protein FliP
MATVTTTGDTSRRRERHNLVRHFIEMVLAMIVGMVVLGMAAALICAALGQAGFLTDHAGLRSFVMVLNMSIGMAVWMRYRGHGWTPIGEMVGAMCLPWALLIGPYLGGAISAGALLLGMHVLMFPAMIAAMFHRRDEYAHDHRHGQHASLR